MYIVAIQYSREAGGRYGVITYQEYPHQQAFQNTRLPKDTRVIQQGITLEEAHRLVASTPEICILLATIEAVFEYNTEPTKGQIDFHLSNSVLTIQNNRVIRHKHHTGQPVPPDFDKHIENLKRTPGLKGIHFQTVIKLCDTNTGHLIKEP